MILIGLDGQKKNTQQRRGAKQKRDPQAVTLLSKMDRHRHAKAAD
jgi:hypothetical protein